ncbi:hypothetical protein QAD02_013118 [Eretmocerus hayati]|uniref:Uncharacterized protein n=1 Tax=Eretmocerus hayati TaxID=131215 RepID=A0ACC2P1M8_9HYME|nr:hypothetical protein QAD02_013118 [Eretmocerus hayati]
MDTRCVNPFEKENHKATKGLVNVSKNISEKYPSIPEYSKICVAFLEQIKEEFSSSEDKRERILLLTLAPKFWSRNDPVEEFGCTEWEARRAKGLVSDRGILSWPDKKRGKTLSPDVVDAVKAYYNRDDNSRLMPGMNDYISKTTPLWSRTQSFHWNNNQATIFTVVIYYVENGELKHESLAIISDNLAHDTYFVYQYQKIIIEYLKKNFELVTKIFHVTDGASQHFKNKSNFANLVAHEKDFGVVAEWHFHATAHGKGACGGIGANLKRDAKQASSQCSS